MDKQKLVNLLGASTVTAVLLIIMLAFGGEWNGGGSTAVDAASAPDTNVQVVPIDSYNALEQENEQLQEALDTMIDREAQYQTQLDQANQLLDEAAAPAYEEEYEEEAYEEYEDEDDDEEEEYEDDDDDEYEDD